MKEKEEKWALFWCDLLKPIIYGDIEQEQINQYLKELAQKEVIFPDGTLRRPQCVHPQAQAQSVQRGWL
jgi:hypothetical protein